MLCILVVKMSLLLVSKQSSLTKQERIHDQEREAEIFYILPSIEKYEKKDIVSFHPSFETFTLDHFYSDFDPELFWCMQI